MKRCNFVFAILLIAINCISPLKGQTPIASVTPDSLSVSFNTCEDSLTVPIQIHNSGTAPLFYSVLQISNFYDGFEDGMGKWTATSHWGLESPGYAGENYVTESVGGNYGNYWDEYLTLKDSLIIALKDSAKLSFYVKYSLECNYDYLYVQLSVNNGSWQNLDVYNCPVTSWTLKQYNLSSYVNDGDYIKIRYYFHSDGSVIRDGTGIDEVYISGVGNLVDWVSFPVPSGVVMPGLTETMNVVFSTTGLITGSYPYTIIILTNDPLSPQLFIYTYTVLNGYPVLTPLATTHDFGSLFVHAYNIDTLQVVNEGCDTLIIDNITASASQFEVLQTFYSFLPGQSINIPVRFEPDSVGFFSSELYFTCNDTTLSPSTSVMILTGTGLPTPEIAVVPDSLSTSVLCGDSIALSFTLYNTGQSSLNYQISTFNSDGLILYYPLNGDASDMTLFDRDGTLYGPAPTQDRFGNAGMALSFDGSNDYIDVPDGVYFNGDFTVNAWVNEAAYRSYSRLFDFGNGPNADNIMGIMSRGTSGYYATSIYNGSSFPGHIYATQSLPINQWLMVTQVQQGYTTNIYLNGSLIKSANSTYIPLNVMRTSNYIGKSNWPDDYYYQGKFDDFRIYDRALTPDEITNIYQEESSSWLTCTPDSGAVQMNDSTIITVSINTLGMVAGDYLTHINIETNDPVNPMVSLPVALHVYGDPHIETDTSALNFDTTMQYVPVSLPLIISNTGCDSLHISAFDLSLPQFELISHAAPIHMGPNSSFTATLRFLSADTGTFNGTFTIVNDDVNAIIQLTAVATGAPVIQLDPDTAYAYFVNCNDSADITGTITNNGLIDLNWNANNQEGSGTALSFNGSGQYVSVGSLGAMPTAGTIEFWAWSNTLMSYNNVFCTNGLSYSNVGVRFEETGSGQFYAVVGNDGGGANSYSYTYSLDINTWHHYALTWDKTLNQVWGYMDGVEVFAGSSCYNWATNWTDAYIGAGYQSNRYWMGNIEEVRIWNYKRSYDQIQTYYNLSLSGAEAGLIAYWNFNEGSGNTVYDQTPNGHNGTFTGASWIESLLPFTSFVTVSPASGTLSPGQSQELTYTFKTDSNVTGQYFGIIPFLSNDPVNGYFMYPVSMEILGSPVISVNPVELHFGDMMVGGVMELPLTIFNTGCDTLVVDSVIYNNLDIFHFNNLPLVILPFDSGIVNVAFHPLNQVYYDDMVVFYSNTDPLSLFVDGTGAPTPVISVDPTQLEAFVTCSDSTYLPLTVFNNGNADLIISFGGVTGTGVGVPVPAECIPQTQGYCCEMGILHFSLNTIDTITNNASEGYQDYTASQSTVLMPGQAYNIEVQTGPNYSENVTVWLDYNNNGIFEDDENIMTSNYGPTHTGTFTPPLNAVMNTPLRLRVAAEYYGNGVPTACSYPEYSQDEDYTVFIISGIYPPEVNDTIPPLGQITYDVLFSGNNLSAGYYTSIININTNDPVSPTLQVPCSLTVSGGGQLTLSESYHDFGDVMVHTTSYYAVILENTGCDTVYIINYYSTNSVNDAYIDTNLLGHGESTNLYFSFHPDTTGYYEGEIWIITNIGDFNVFVVGTGTPAPEIMIDPDALSVQLGCGDSTEIPVTIYNNGEADLHYQVNVNPGINEGLLMYYPFIGDGKDYSPNHRDLNNHGAQLTTGNTGLGDNAYSFNDSATMSYDNTSDIYNNLFPNQFTLSFWVKFPDPATWQVENPVLMSLSGYYYNYDGIYVQADGTSIYAYFTIDWGYYYLYCPMDIDQWTHIAYTYDGQTMSGYRNGTLFYSFNVSGNMYHYDDNPAFILGNWNNPPTDAKYFTGDMDEFRYYGRALSEEEIGALASSTTGLFSIQADPVQGTVYVGESQQLTLSIGSNGLNAGTYQDIVDIASDDPLQPHVYLPVTLEIIGTPEITVTPECLDYDTIMQFTQQTLEILIENPSCTPLYVWNMSTATSSFYPAFPNVIVPPYGSNTVPVTFNPDWEGLNEDTLYIDSEAGLNKVCLRGYCTGIPVAVVDPASINRVLSCEENDTMTFQLRNEGLAAMEYQITVAPTIWFSGINMSGSLDAGNNINIDFILNRLGVPTGLYNLVVPIVTSDPLHQLINLPVYLLIPNPLVPVDLGSDTGYCVGDTYTFHAGNYASYLWSDGSSGSTLTVNSPGTYWVNVVDYYNCPSTDTALLSEYPYPIALAGNDTSICEGGNIQLHGNSNNTIPPYPVQIKIGSGTDFYAEVGPNPFGTYYMDHRSQYLYKHSELIEAGLSPGNITALGFILNGVGAPGMQNFNIRIKTTPNSSISSFESGFTDVYYQSVYYPVIGQNVFTLEPPFFWDGSGGIIVEVCFDNNNWIRNSSYEYTNVTNCVISRYCDNCAPGCVLSNGTYYTERPNLLINGDGDITQYHWTGPSGFVSDLRNPIINNLLTVQSGIYSLIVNNGIGCTATDDIEVIVKPRPVVYAGLDGNILGGETFQFNPTITGGVPPYSYYWSPSLYLDDSSLLQATSMPVFTTTYTLNVTGFNGCYNSDVLTVTVIPRFSLSGHVTYDNYLYSALPGVKVKVRHSTGTPYDSAYTDQSGNYYFQYLIEGTYLVTASTTLPTGSINATDALMIGKHVVAMENLSGLPLKAADVNASTTVTGADALLVLHHTVGNITTFPAGDWYLEQKNVTIAGANKAQDLLGVCYGDVNLSFIPGMKQEPAITLETEGILTVSPDESFLLPVKIKQGMLLGAATLNFIIPEKYFVIEDVLMPEGTGIYKSKGDILHIAWSNTDAVTMDAADIMLQIKMRRTSLSPPENNGIELSSDCELADGNAEIIGYQSLIIPKVLNAIQYPDGFYLGQNQPNPFNQTSVIPYCLPESGQVKLEIFNVLGEKVGQIDEGQQKEGQHNLLISARTLPAGIYYYKMTYRSKYYHLYQTRSLIISK